MRRSGGAGRTRIAGGGYVAGLGVAVLVAVQPTALDEMIRTERAFSARSVEVGMRQAFLEFLADSVVLFRPGPVVGVAAVRDAPDLDGTLSWAPARAEIASSGDVGYTTGPYRIVRGGEAVAHGHYLTIWGRPPPDPASGAARARGGPSGGAFRALLDIGIPHGPVPEPDTVSTPGTRRPAPGGSPERPPSSADPGATGADRGPRSARVTLLAADRALSTARATSSPDVAYGRHALDRLWLFRSGFEPFRGRESAVAHLIGAGEMATDAVVAGAGVSRAGDFGWVYGTLDVGSGVGPGNPASYVRVWRRVEGRWKLAAEVVSLHP